MAKVEVSSEQVAQLIDQNARLLAIVEKQNAAPPGVAPLTVQAALDARTAEFKARQPPHPEKLIPAISRETGAALTARYSYKSVEVSDRGEVLKSDWVLIGLEGYE